MSTNTALDQIKARVEGLSDLCPEYMHLAIRNSVRNCDFDCQAHGEEEDCGPGQSDGARIAHSLGDVPKLLAALEAVEALAAGFDASSQIVNRGDEAERGFNMALKTASMTIRQAITEALR